MKILVVRYRAIGDCVMTAWPVTAIRKAFPDAEIVWAVENQCASVIDRSELVERVYKMPRQRWKKHRWSPAIWKEQLTRYLTLRQLKFDLGVDFQGHSKTAICLRLANPAVRISSFGTDAFARLLNPVVHVPGGEDLHMVEYQMAVINTYRHFETPVIPIMPGDLGEIEGLPDQPFVSVMTGASAERKRYPFCQELVNQLVNSGVPVVVVGGDRDQRVEGGVDKVGKLSLRGTMEVVRRSRVHIAPDTGTGHIAAAYGVPVVSLFSEGYESPQRFRPFSAFGTVLSLDSSPGAVFDVANNWFLSGFGAEL